MHNYNNPTPVAVLLVPFTTSTGVRLLLVKRNIEPKKGMFALPGGFVDEGESIETAAVRELYEETGIKLPSENAIQLWMSKVTPSNQVLIFCIVHHDEFGDMNALTVNEEVSEFKLSSVNGDDEWAFPLHAIVATSYLKLRNSLA